MRRISRYCVPAVIALVLGLSMSVFGVSLEQTCQAANNCAESWQNSDIRVGSLKSEVGSLKSEVGSLESGVGSLELAKPSPTPPIEQEEDATGLRRACAEAVDELRAARRLLEKQDIEIKRQAEMIVLEQKIAEKLEDIRTLDENEKAELRTALAAKDAQITATEAALATAKKQKQTFWKNARAVTIGVAAGVIFGLVLK